MPMQPQQQLAVLPMGSRGIRKPRGLNMEQENPIFKVQKERLN